MGLQYFINNLTFSNQSVYSYICDFVYMLLKKIEFIKRYIYKKVETGLLKIYRKI